MDIKPIKTDADYRTALKEIESLMMAGPDTPEGEKLDVMVTLIEAYEVKHFPMDLPDPVEAIKFEMERKGLTVKDLEPMIGKNNRVYEILNHKRSLTKLHDISAIDSRLADLEQEKQQLIEFRAELQKSKPAPPISDSFFPKQKIAIFKNLFRGRTDIFASRWQNQRRRSGYSVACDDEWVQGVCNKPRIRCLDCTHR